MSIDYSKYPANWKTEIRPRILARAANRCERCGVKNNIHIIRSAENGARFIELDAEGDYMIDGEYIKMSEEPSEFADSALTRVVLTIAHLDHDITHNDDSNLMALCQRCHLLHDGKMHATHAAETRRRQHIAATGQMELGL